MFAIEDRGGVRRLSLAHGKVSAMDLELMEGLAGQLEDAEEAPIGALVLTGSGTTFSAGVDLVRVVAGGADYLERFLPAFGRALERLYRFPKPVVAAVNGHAIAGGAIFALACDRRLAAAGEARIGVPELRIGLPFPALALELVRAAVPAPAFERTIQEGALYGPQDARALGLIDEVVPPGELAERAERLARELAALDPAAYALNKLEMRAPHLERAARVAERHDGAVAAHWARPESLRAVAAYLERTIGKSVRTRDRPTER